MVVPLYSNKHTIKIFFTTQLFLFTYIPNNITDIFFTGVAFLYTINVVHASLSLLTWPPCLASMINIGG